MEVENDEFMFVVFTEKIELVAMVFKIVVVVVGLLDLSFGFGLTCLLTVN